MSEDVRKGLMRLFQKAQPIQVYPGVVDSVDESKFTCDVKPADGGPLFYDVRLKTNINSDNNGMICIPEVGSDVFISAIGNNRNWAFVSLYSKIKKYLIVCSNGVKIEITENGELHLNGDSLGGLIKINELKAELNKTNDVLLAIVQALSTWTVVPNDGGAALKVMANTLLTGKSVGNYSNIENVKVKHG
jgi:hypothetical protein